MCEVHINISADVIYSIRCVRCCLKKINRNLLVPWITYLGGHKLPSCQRGGATPLNLFKTPCKLCLCSAPPPRLCLDLHCLALLCFYLLWLLWFSLPYLALLLPCIYSAFTLPCFILNLFIFPLHFSTFTLPLLLH